MAPPRLTRKGFDGLRPVRKTASAIPFPTCALPADRTSWPLLTHGELSSAYYAAWLDLHLLRTRVAIAHYGGSTALLRPLFDARANSYRSAVPLDVALGDTLHPLRLSYLIEHMQRNANERETILSLLPSALDALQVSQTMASHFVASHLADAVRQAYGDDPEVAAILRSCNMVSSVETTVCPSITYVLGLDAHQLNMLRLI